MSHLITKTEAQEPNRQGLLSLSLSDLPEININSPSNGDGLQYDDTSSSWNAASISGSFDITSFSITNGFAANALSTVYNSNNEQNGFYMSCRSKLYNDVLMTKSNNSNLVIEEREINLGAIFITGFTVQPGAKLLMSCDVCLAENSPTTSHIDLQWQTTTGTKLGPLVRCKIQASFNRNRVVGFFHNDTESEVEIGLRRLNQSGNIYYPQSTEIRREYVLFGREF